MDRWTDEKLTSIVTTHRGDYEELAIEVAETLLRNRGVETKTEEKIVSDEVDQALVDEIKGRMFKGERRALIKRDFEKRGINWDLYEFEKPREPTEVIEKQDELDPDGRRKVKWQHGLGYLLIFAGASSIIFGGFEIWRIVPSGIMVSIGVWLARSA